MNTKLLMRAIILGGGLALVASPVLADGESSTHENQRAQEQTWKSDVNVDLLDQQQVMQLQEVLKDRGQDPGKIDGIMGPETREALAQFQRENDLQPTGSLNEQTAKELDLEFTEVQRPTAQGK